MESTQLGKKIRDWAISLGFRLPDGSIPPANYFALLTATPHRRQLWEVVVELVQSRQKIEFARKQILVAKLQNGKRFDSNNSEEVTDRIELWRKQNGMENEFKKKRNAVIKLQDNTMAKASDLLFEICRLAELEKQLEELEEKSLVLKLFSRKEKEVIEVFERTLCKENGAPNLNDNLEKFGKKLQENIDRFKKEVTNIEECKCRLFDGHNCELLHKIEELCKLGTSEDFLWEEIIKLKQNVLEKFSTSWKELNSIEKSILGHKNAEVEENMNQLMTQLKQKMTEKSLQMIINSTEGKVLDSEVKNLEDRLDHGGLKGKTLSDTISFILDGTSEACEENEKRLEAFKNYLKTIGFKSYQEFLKKELNGLEGKWAKTEQKHEGKESRSGEEEIQLILKDFESVVNEINLSRSEEKEVEREIFRQRDKLQMLARLLEKETETKSETKAVDVAVEKLKLSSRKRIDVFSEIPLEAFRTVENRSSRSQFECEPAIHCLKNHGGELKQTFSAMLIPPSGEVKNVLSEVERRKQIINEIKKFISERRKLTIIQKNILDELSSLNYDSLLCKKNFEESSGVLRNIFFKTDDLLSETDLIDKILRNWVQQPYKLMIKETGEGKSYKKYEEQYVGETDE